MQKPYLVGISGSSGAGKTTFINAIKAQFSGQQLNVFSLDNYYKSKEAQLTDAKGIHNFDLPTSLDTEKLKTDIEKLINWQPVYYTEYNFNNPEKIAETITFNPAPIIIIEGLFIFHYEFIREVLDLKVFLHTNANTSLIRRIKRDQIERNYPLDDVLYRYEHHVMPAFRTFIEPYREDCDIVINNNHHYDNGLKILTAYLTQVANSNAIK